MMGSTTRRTANGLEQQTVARWAACTVREIFQVAVVVEGDQVGATPQVVAEIPVAVMALGAVAAAVVEVIERD